MTSATVENPDKTELAEESENFSTVDNANESGKTKKNINRDNLHYYYSAGDFHFILQKGFKPETLENTALTSVPFLPEWYAGILSIHGLIIPVIDIIKFTNNNNLNNSVSANKKHYLLKLEHADHQPLVLKLDALPKIINTEKMNSIQPDQDSPEWVKNYLDNGSIKLAYVDHLKLFDQLINQQ